MPAVAAEPDYFTITNTSSKTAIIYLDRRSTGNYSTNNLNIAYSINGGTWTEEITYGTSANDALIISLPAGQNVRFRGYNLKNGTWQCGKSKSIYFGFNFPTSGTSFTVSGDLMSLVSYRDGKLHTDDYPMGGYCFTKLFNGCTKLVDVSELKLSAATLSDNCYLSMFSGCTAITSAPQMSATTLAANCYQSMFNSCTSLTEAPQLPVMTLKNDCYAYMFSGCTALISAPNLPATTLTEGCYQYMFQGCSSLENVQNELPGTNLPQNCYQYMFSGCKSLITAPEIMAAADVVPGLRSCDNMFASCTSLTKAPSKLLPTTINNNLTYSHMFFDCPALTEGPDIYATTIGSGGTKLQYMFANSTNLRKIRVYFTAWGTMSFCSYWTNHVNASGAFYCPPELQRIYNGSQTTPSFIPDNWVIFSYNLTYIPVGGEWPMGGIEPQLYTWQTDTNYVQGWMRYLDTYGAAYYHDEACTQSFPEEEIIAFLATQQEISSDITKNIYVKLGEVETPQTERYEFVSYPLKDEDKYEFDCTPASPDPETPEENTCDHEWVQLWTGGPKWATVNLGASTPEEAGDYFMWAGTTANPSSCSWASCPYIGSNQNTAPYSKYGYAQDGLIELQVDDDAARQAWGCGWRIPTREEMTELITRCTVTYNQSKRGYTFTSKEDTSRSIFMPTAGYKNGGTVFNVGKYARYLTATSTTTPSTNTKDRDCYILYWYVNSNYQEDHKPETSTMSVRYWGMSIRPVCD